MPKNAVPRLQKIENNIKTVISIYEVVDNSNKNDKFEKPKRENVSPLCQIGPPKQSEGPMLSDESQSRPGPPETSLLDSFEKPADVVTQPRQRVFTSASMLESNKWRLKKPGSAPSSFSALSTTCESSFIRQQTSSSANKVLEQITLSKAKTFDNLNTLNLSDSRNFSKYELPMTPSKTLETANRILIKNNYKEDDVEDYEPVLCAEAKKMEDFSSSRIQEVPLTLDVKSNDVPKENSIPDLEKFKKDLQTQNVIVEKNRSTFLRKKNLAENVTPEPKSAEPKLFGSPMSYVNTIKDKSFSNASPMRTMTPEKMFKPDIESIEGKTRTKARRSQEKINRFEKCKTEQNDRAIKDNEDITNDIKFLEEVKSKLSEKANSKVKQEKSGVIEKKNVMELEIEKKVQCYQANSTWDNQKTHKAAEYKDEKLWVKEFSKIIEKSNEKLEKMKFSKELALDIAKHLKDKCEEIQQSKQELIEKVQKVEKDNERLTDEVKDVQESNMIWQLRFIELKKDSRTKLTEQSAETKDVLEENVWLKTKLCELRKHCTEELLEKQKEINRIQAERLEEMRNEMIDRKNRADVQRLTNENSKLLSKTEALQRLLNESYSQIKVQEERIREFEEEVQIQKQHLQKKVRGRHKTERLEETYKELELIRRNYNDLEEQVKSLRKNFENFDEMQQNLMKQIMEYEQQMKTKQEEIKTLQNENLKLKTELENEKDALLIKIKIIEDQQETIKQLREKSEEVKTLLKRNQSLERVISIEREEKLELQEAVERLKRRKEELKKKVKSLENDLFLAPQEVVRDLQKTQIVLHELESQVQKKQKEWEIQMQSLIREKEQACSVAEFATKKLMQTTNEFQRQSDAHKSLKRALAENLAEKEKNLQDAKGKVSHLPLKQTVLHGIPNNIVSGRQKDPTLSNFRLRQ